MDSVVVLQSFNAEGSPLEGASAKKENQSINSDAMSNDGTSVNDSIANKNDEGRGLTVKESSARVTPSLN